MKVKNISNSVAIVTDMVTSGQGLVIGPKQEMSLRDEDAGKSVVLKHYIADGIIEVIGLNKPVPKVGNITPPAVSSSVVPPISTPAKTIPVAKDDTGVQKTQGVKGDTGVKSNTSV